jgi:hypothetical protein
VVLLGLAAAAQAHLKISHKIMFSKQSYSGQGMVQPMVTSQAGQNLARGIEKFGEGIGQAFKSAGESRKLRAKLAPFADEFMPDNIKGTPQEKEFTKMFETRLDDMGLKELEGMSENLLLKKSLQMYDARIKQAQLQNQTAQRGINQGIAQDAFDVSLLSGQPPHQAALSAFQSTNTVPPGAAKAAMDRSQATAFAQGVDQDFPAGADISTMQAIERSRRGTLEDKMAAAKNEQESRNIESLISYRDKQANLYDAQAEASRREAQQKIQAQFDRGGLTEEQAKMSSDMFDKLNASQPVKQFGALQAQYSALENLILEKDSLQGPGDISIVFTFMKSLDPNSVVRESEFQVAARAGGLPEQLVNEYTKITEGSFLTDDMKQKFLSSARQAASSYVESANNERQRYVDQGARFGISEEYSGGKPYFLKAKTYASEEEAIKAGQAGALKPGQQFFIYKNGRFQPNILEADQ